jgi:hypothetical protein
MQDAMNATHKKCFTCFGDPTSVMTRDGSDVRYVCDGCLRIWREVGATEGWTIEVVTPEPASLVKVTVHIRQRPARKWGDGFYRPQYSASENGSRTLCGAPSTDQDMTWGECRYAKNLAYVTCDECKRLRQP